MYYKRLIEKEIQNKLKTSGAILVCGPKFCGKTTTCMRYQKSFIKLNTKAAIEFAQLDSKKVLDGKNPRLIDEWQTVADIWNQVKDDLDNEYSFGKYILTGSSTPADKREVYHSGAGRITSVKMRPMSLFESKDSKGTISISDLFMGGENFSPSLNRTFSIDDIAFLICRGGWPISVCADKQIAIEITKNYCNSLFTFEESHNESFRNKKPEILRMILRSYARNISSEASYSTMIEDVKQNNERSMDPKTFNDYLSALKDLFIIEDIEAWNPNIRSKTALRTTPTRHFVDTSIACQALSIGPENLKQDLNTFGLFFEDLAVRDLKIYSSYLGGDVKHYRDNSGLECDAVIHLNNGKWGAIEIKLGGEKLIDEAAASLIRLKSKIAQKSNEPAPSFLMVLTAVGSAHKRRDGVFVVPINLLKP